MAHKPLLNELSLEGPTLEDGKIDNLPLLNGCPASGEWFRDNSQHGAHLSRKEGWATIGPTREDSYETALEKK